MKTLVLAMFALLCAGSTKASADCRDEVAAAFDRQRTSGRPYRKETTWVISDQQSSHEIFEFVPPDRMRGITSNGVPGYAPTEIIRIGQRAWLNENGGWPWGWREWDPKPADDIRARMEVIPADDVDARTRIFREATDFAAAHLLLMQNDYPIPADAVFECLGKSEFEGTTYIGYRNRVMGSRIVRVSPGASSETGQQVLSRSPQEWRTVFVDRESMLPAYDLMSQEYQLYKPGHKVQYTYPIDIKIAAPFWCRLGLCPFHR